MRRSRRSIAEQRLREDDRIRRLFAWQLSTAKSDEERMVIVGSQVRASIAEVEEALRRSA